MALELIFRQMDQNLSRLCTIPRGNDELSSLSLVGGNRSISRAHEADCANFSTARYPWETMNATLWRTDGTGLRIQAEMHDVAEQREVGVLKFSYASFPSEDEKIVDVRSTFGPELVVSKLIIHESGTSAESGIIIKSAAGDEILIVAAAMPYSLAVSGVLMGAHVFDPEYPVDSYKNVPI